MLLGNIYVMCWQCRSRSACTSMQSDLKASLFAYLINDYTDSVALESDCADVQADLELHCPHYYEMWPFTDVACSRIRDNVIWGKWRTDAARWRWRGRNNEINTDCEGYFHSIPGIKQEHNNWTVMWLHSQSGQQTHNLDRQTLLVVKAGGQCWKSMLEV